MNTRYTRDSVTQEVVSGVYSKIAEIITQNSTSEISHLLTTCQTKINEIFNANNNNYFKKLYDMLFELNKLRNQAEIAKNQQLYEMITLILIEYLKQQLEACWDQTLNE